MKHALKNIFNNLLRFGLSGALLYWLYTKIDIPHTVEVIKTAELKYIGYAFVIFMVINVILIMRWFVFIRALDLQVPFLTAVRYYLIGLFGNLFLPSAIGGDVIKILGLCQTSHQKPKVVASVLLDRLSGFGGMVIVATGSLIFGYRMIQDASIGWTIVAMALGSFSVGVVLFNQTAYSFCCQIFAGVPKVKNSLMKLHYDIALLKDRPGKIVEAVLWSSFSQVVLGIAFFLISKAFHVNTSLFYFIIFMPLICLISTVPSIGGLGVREAGVAYFYGKVGVASGIAVSISLINFLYMIIVGLLGGLVFLVTQPPQVKNPDDKG